MSLCTVQIIIVLPLLPADCQLMKIDDGDKFPLSTIHIFHHKFVLVAVMSYSKRYAKCSQ